MSVTPNGASPSMTAFMTAAGDAIAFSAVTPHASAANDTDGWRRALVLRYVPDGAVVVANGERRRQDGPHQFLVG